MGSDHAKREIQDFDRIAEQLDWSQMLGSDPSRENFQPLAVLRQPDKLRSYCPLVAEIVADINWGEAPNGPIPMHLETLLWNRERYRVLNRARCAHCRRLVEEGKPGKREWQMGWVVAPYYGGRYELDNAVLMCQACRYHQKRRMPFSIREWERRLNVGLGTEVHQVMLELVAVGAVASFIGPLSAVVTGGMLILHQFGVWETDPGWAYDR